MGCVGEAALALMQLEGFGNRPVQKMSGGQQQRVAVARALVIEPDVLLMDEPPGALDRQLRQQVQVELRRLHLKHGRTTIQVTHDQEEALVLSDRIAVMGVRLIHQFGTAAEHYARPANSFVAGFVGESKLLAARVLRVADGMAQRSRRSTPRPPKPPGSSRWSKRTSLPSGRGWIWALQLATAPQCVRLPGRQRRSSMRADGWCCRACKTGGHFVQEATGEPTGMLNESAVKRVRARMPAPTDADHAEGVRFGQALGNRHGITGVVDASVGAWHARVHRGLAADDALTVRVAATARVDPAEETADALARVSTLRNESAGLAMLKVHSAKFFIDGVFENRTTTMLADYSDAAGGNAPPLFAPEQISDLFAAFDSARFQIPCHVIGDRAVRAALDGLAAAPRANGHWPSLHQMAHVQCIDPVDLPRFAELGAMANIQPFRARHAPSVDLALNMIGPDRGRLMHAFRRLLDARAPFALSSAWG